MNTGITRNLALWLAAAALACACQEHDHDHPHGLDHAPDHDRDHTDHAEHDPARSAPGSGDDDRGHTHPRERAEGHPVPAPPAQRPDHGLCSARLDAAVCDDLDVATATVAQEPFAPSVGIPGVLQVDPDRRVDVSAPLTARILALDAPPHASVEAGERLALLEVVDPEVRDLQIRAVEIRAELLAARTGRDRTRAYLEALGAGRGTVAEERRRVEADLKVLDARVRSRRSALDAVLAALDVSGLSRPQIRALERQGRVVTRVRLSAPRLPGGPVLEVTARPVHRGQAVPAGTRLFELVALDRLRVTGEAFEADVPAVRRAMRDGLPISVSLPAEGRRVDGLQIVAMEGTLDGEQRITHFFGWLDNRIVAERRDGSLRYLDRTYRAGSRVRIEVATRKATPRIQFPIGALVRSGGQQVVYRVRPDGCERVPVRVESMDEKRVVLAREGGLEPGDRVVVQGALQVHLALEKSLREGSAGAGHGHHH